MIRFGMVIVALFLSWQTMAQTPYQILQEIFEDQNFGHLSESDPDSELKPSENIPNTFPELIEFLKQFPQELATVLESQHIELQPDETLFLAIISSNALQKFHYSKQLAYQLTSQFPETEMAPMGYYYWIQAQIELEEIPPIPNEPELALLFRLDSNLRFQIFSDLRQLALQQKNIHAAIEYGVWQIQEHDDPQLQQQLLLELDELESTDLLNTLIDTYSNHTFVQKTKDILRLQMLARIAPDEAWEEIKVLMQAAQSYGDTELEQRLNLLKRQLKIKMSLNLRRIGVVLPINSPNVQVNRITSQVIEGLKLALLDSSIADEGLGELQLVFRNSRLSAIETRRAVQTLIEQEKVSAVLGPITLKTSIAAAEEAQSLKVPLISFSQTLDIVNIGNFIFRSHHDWKKEIVALARHAVLNEGRRRFAILYPDTKDGKRKAKLFWSEVERLHAKVVAISHFTGREKTFIPQFDTLTGKNRWIMPAFQSPRNFEGEFQDEAPQIWNDFDALFIPLNRNNPQLVKVILPYLRLYRLESSLLLGDSLWNDNRVMTELAQYRELQGAFTDFFEYQLKRVIDDPFLSLYHKYFFKPNYYQTPSKYTAYAYYTLRKLRKILASGKIQTHHQLQQALLHQNLLTDEPFVFDKSGQIQQPLHLFQTKKIQIK